MPPEAKQIRSSLLDRGHLDLNILADEVNGKHRATVAKYWALAPVLQAFTTKAATDDEHTASAKTKFIADQLFYNHGRARQALISWTTCSTQVDALVFEEKQAANDFGGKATPSVEQVKTRDAGVHEFRLAAMRKLMELSRLDEAIADEWSRASMLLPAAEMAKVERALEKQLE